MMTIPAPRLLTIREYVRQVRAHRRRMATFWPGVYELVTGYPLSSTVLRSFRAHDREKWFFLPWLIWFRCGRGNRRVARWGYDLMNRVGELLWPSTTQVRICDCADRHLDAMARLELGDDAPPLSAFLTGRELATGEMLADWVRLNGGLP